LNQERENIFSNECDADQEEQLPKITEIVGDMQAGVKSKGAATTAGGNDTNETGKGKSLYVGQWDAIKERMVWETLEKGNEVARSGENIWHADLVEAFQVKPVRNFQGQGSSNKGRIGLQGKSKDVTSHNGPKHAGWKRSNGEDPADNNGEAGVKKTGKRKTLAAQGIYEKRDGKRYRLVDEDDEGRSDDEAVAAEQPRHTQ
jgi:hypothetical protein